MRFANSVVLGNPPHDSTEWHALRKGGIGASEVGALLDARLAGWGGPVSIRAAKRGMTVPSPDSVPMAVGRAIEASILAAASERLGVEVHGTPGQLAHADHGCIRANLDGWIAGPDGAPSAVVEAKWTSGDMTEPDERAAWLRELQCRDSFEALSRWLSGDEEAEAGFVGSAAHRYLWQVQAQLAVTGLPVAYLAVVVGWQKATEALALGRNVSLDHLVEVPRIPEMIAAIESEVPAFWARHVVAGVPCPPDVASDADLAAVRRAWAMERKRRRVVREDLLSAAQAWWQLKSESATADQARKALEAAIVDAVEDADVLDLGGGAEIRITHVAGGRGRAGHLRLRPVGLEASGNVE